MSERDALAALKDTPGPGHKARRLVVLDADEFASWHGGKAK